ncbi:fimbrial biogenesis chaperone [Chitinophaga silvisoli]|uniref:molecular chaperone n=1 Tax=Chitinophaga silvisoli TaxID=2291814 RepID=UPI0011C129AF|nr:molecular chaperone [Chitinophaga silvisoli]
MRLIQMRQLLLRIGVLLTTIFYLPVQLKAQGDLLITPRRIVFEGGSRLQEINLANSGSDTARYVISLVEVRMNVNGTFEFINAPDSGQLFASNFLRFFPHSVILPPKEAQVVKVQLQHTADLDTGEYRSHIYFRAVPKQQPLGDEKQLDSPQTISIKLTPVFGITIPVIIRVGKNNASASMSDISLTMEDTIPKLNLTFHREGNMSVYGDLSVDHISPSGKVTPIGSLKGVAVYTPNRARQLHVALARVSGVNYHSGKLRLSYLEIPTQMNAKVEVLATSEISLN